jgi:hypothetical protein
LLFFVLVIAILPGGNGILLWFWFSFLWWLIILSTFSCIYWPFVFLLLRSVYSDHLPIFKLGYSFLFCFVFFKLI